MPQTHYGGWRRTPWGIKRIHGRHRKITRKCTVENKKSMTQAERADAGRTAAQVEERSYERRKATTVAGVRTAPVFYRNTNLGEIGHGNGGSGKKNSANLNNARDVYAPLRRTVEEKARIESMTGANGTAVETDRLKHQTPEAEPAMQVATTERERVESFWEWSPPPLGDEEIVLSREVKATKPSIELLRQAAMKPMSSASSSPPPTVASSATPTMSTGDSAEAVTATQDELQDIEVDTTIDSFGSSSTPPAATLPPAVSGALSKDTAAAIINGERRSSSTSSSSSYFLSSERMMSPALDAVDGAKSSGIEADGSRWWRESGTEEVGDGRLRRWVCLRGASAAGDLEWEQRWWETSDATGYRELGAEKSGRDRDGNVWRENWLESLDMRANSTDAVIERCADKWARAPDLSEWHETWAEEFTTAGAVKRSADKWGCKAPGAIPEDGHGNRWQERWGEEWDGNGNVTKWTDKWAERDQAEGGGPPRAWGDKWEERNSSTNSTGSKNVRYIHIRTWITHSPRVVVVRMNEIARLSLSLSLLLFPPPLYGVCAWCFA